MTIRTIRAAAGAFILALALTACVDATTSPEPSEPALSEMAALRVSTVTSAANTNPINIKISGTPAYGKSVLVTFAVSQAGKPVAKQRIRVWFRGSSGIESSKWTFTTDARGFISRTLRVPSWQARSRSLTIAASVESIGAYNEWRLLK